MCVKLFSIRHANSVFKKMLSNLYKIGNEPFFQMSHWVIVLLLTSPVYVVEKSHYKTYVLQVFLPVLMLFISLTLSLKIKIGVVQVNGSLPPPWAKPNIGINTAAMANCKLLGC